MTKRLLGAALVATLGSTMLFAQAGIKTGSRAATEHTIRKLETSLWQAWKDHEAGPFEKLLTEDSINIVGTPEHGKASEVKIITSKTCKVSSFSLSDFAYTWLDSRSLIVTYTATQEGACGGRKVPGKVNASSAWVKRGGQWLSAFHQESEAM